MEFTTFFLINVVRVYKFAILARVLLSWLPRSRNTRFARFIFELTEPVLRIFRRILPRMGMIDLSPLIAFLAMDFLQLALLKGLTSFM